MDFRLDPVVEQYRLRIRDFVAEHILPLEEKREQWGHGENIDLEVLKPLQEKARGENLWAIQMPKARGGQGFGPVGMAVCYEELHFWPGGI